MQSKKAKQKEEIREEAQSARKEKKIGKERKKYKEKASDLLYSSQKDN